MQQFYTIITIFIFSTILLVTAWSKEAVEITPATKTLAIEVTDQADLDTGQKIYEKDCGYCHATGTLNAPVVGKKNLWERLSHQGLGHLVENTIFGIGEMEPKGGAHMLSDAEIRLAVVYMVQQSE